MILSLLLGCQNYELASTEDGSLDSSADSIIEEDTSDWDGAWMEVLTPSSGDFLPLDEDSDFEAVIYYADGTEADFGDIQWSTDADEGWALLGSAIVDDSLDVGEHDITAEALLPNGDRLVYTMGGILVQHEDAGTYVGNVKVDVTLAYDGVDYSAGCTGAVTIIVDVYGESALGDSTCTLSLLGYDQDTSYGFDLEVDEGDVSGAAEVDLSLFAYDFDMDGDLEDGELSGSWDDDIFGYVGVAGELSATRISRSVGDE
ncbi:MAG: hypothetical protein ACI8RZ_007620 [Myxococcota bacterium]|jgi:hypothetical protein